MNFSELTKNLSEHTIKELRELRPTVMEKNRIFHDDRMIRYKNKKEQFRNWLEFKLPTIKSRIEISIGEERFGISVYYSENRCLNLTVDLYYWRDFNPELRVNSFDSKSDDDEVLKNTAKDYLSIATTLLDIITNYKNLLFVTFKNIRKISNEKLDINTHDIDSSIKRKQEDIIYNRHREKLFSGELVNFDNTNGYTDATFIKENNKTYTFELKSYYVEKKFIKKDNELINEIISSMSIDEKDEYIDTLIEPKTYFSFNKNISFRDKRYMQIEGKNLKILGIRNDGYENYIIAKVDKRFFKMTTHKFKNYLRNFNIEELKTFVVNVRKEKLKNILKYL